MPQRAIHSIIDKQRPLVAPRTTTVADAARMMKDHRVSAMMVVDGDKLAGIFTERDALFRVIAEGRNPKLTPVESVMTANPKTIGPDRPILQALIMMHEGGFRHVPVVTNGRPTGMVSARDALGLDWREFQNELERQEHIGEVLG
jgi:CBS domain-containing protein